MRTAYTNLYEINGLQQSLLKFIIYWASIEKTPIPQKKIIEEMKRRKRNSSTIVNSLNGLVRMGYIRPAIATPANSTSYVLLKTI